MGNLKEKSKMVTAANEEPMDGELPEDITPEYVRSLTAPTDQFLCRLSDNTPRLKFKGFRIRDMISNLTLVDVPNEDMTDEELLSDNDDPTKRLIKYHLGPDFLHL